MAGFRELFGKFIMVALLILPLMTLVVVLQNDNDSAQDIRDNNVFNETFGELINVIDNATVEAGEKYDVFNQELPKPGFGSVVLFGIVSVGKTFSNVIFGLFLSVIKLPLIILGIPASIYNLLITWLTVFVIVVVWLLYKLGG